MLIDFWPIFLVSGFHSYVLIVEAIDVSFFRFQVVVISFFLWVLFRCTLVSCTMISSPSRFTYGRLLGHSR